MKPHDHRCRICWKVFACEDVACLIPKQWWKVCPRCYACDTFAEAAKDWPDMEDCA